MKSLLRIKIVLCLTFLFLGGLASAQESFVNFPLPQHPDTLRILSIGNSFSDDGTQYLPDLLESAGIRNVILGRLYIGGCSLERHCREYETGSTAYRYDKSTANAWRTVSAQATLLDGLHDEPWDVITMQESSGYTGVYDIMHTWLPRLIGIVRKEAVNPQATLVWHGTWAYAANSADERFSIYDRSQEKMYESILDCVSKLQADFNIPVVIPCGAAIQLGRNTRLNNADEVPADNPVFDLTRDGYHLSRQFGRYLAACTWFEALIRPTLGIGVVGNPCRLRKTEYSLSAKDARLCQKIAFRACGNSR